MSSSSLNTLRENTLAISSLANILASSLGPHAHSKLIVDPHGKVLVSQDGAFILRQLQVTQPATRLLVDSVLTLDELLGDGTTTAAILTASLIQKAFECASREGIPLFKIVRAYRSALQFIMDHVMSDLIMLMNTTTAAAVATANTSQLRSTIDRNQMEMIIRSCLSSKLTLHMDTQILTELLTDAIYYVTIMNTCLQGEIFDIHRVHLLPIIGQSIHQSILLKNCVLLPYSASLTMTRELPSREDDVSLLYNVAFIHGSLQRQRSRIKHTALLSTVQELRDWQIDEEAEFEKQATHIINTGARAVIVTGQVHRLVSHYLQRANLLVVALEDTSSNHQSSNSYYRFICESLSCKMVYRFEDLTSEHLGRVRSATKKTFGTTGGEFLCFDNSNCQSSESVSRINTCTLVLRSGTKTQSDELVRHCHDAIHSMRAYYSNQKLRNSSRRKRSGRADNEGNDGFLPGAGAFEVECAVRLRKWIWKEQDQVSQSFSSQECSGIECFSDALEIIPRVLCNNSALNVTDTMNLLLQMHEEGDCTAGVPSLFDEEDETGDSIPCVYDNSFTKRAVLRMATDTACSILQIGDVIAAK